jgi:hypothetical protein
MTHKQQQIGLHEENFNLHHTCSADEHMQSVLTFATTPTVRAVQVDVLPAQLQAHYTPGVTIRAPLPANNPTILIIGSYPDGDIYADMALYCTKNNLPPLNDMSKGESDSRYADFYVYYQSGDTKTFSQTKRPMLSNPAWYKEMCIDTQSAHAIAPYANIVLIYANSGSDLLYQAMDFGLSLSSQLNIVSVSCSWGGGESLKSDTWLTKMFTQYDNVICCSATGDLGTATRINHPSANACVVAVGGTSLSPDNVETAWNGTTNGMSSFIPLPDYQNIGGQYTMRTVPDVSMLADNKTGVVIYCMGQYIRGVGGTSVSAPLMAGFIAVLIQQRMINSMKRVNIKHRDFHKILYNNRDNEFDIVTNSTYGLKNNAWTNLNKSAVGYDVCGLGVPIFDKIMSSVTFTVAD